MATLSDALAVKSLNKSAGRRRFVFKTFSQRIEDIEIDVYRSLDPLKAEPSEGSSFFLDCLVQWRELNTAEDFISFYEEMLPLVQTLPQIILQKELILSKLLSRLQMRGRLSLEPILRLVAALSRDLLDDFLPFLQRIADSFESLLQSGADREPEIIEQVFTSWSHIMMYLRKYLMRDVVNVLKVSIKLRYYPKDYVREFMAESVSFLLRNAPLEQLIKGIRKVIFEVAKKPLPTRKSGISALLWYAMKGTSSRLHSKAEQVLPLLVDKSLFGIGDKVTKGADTVLEVLILTFQRLCEELESVELRLMWDCLYKEIADSITKCDLLHLNRLLSLLLSTLQNGYVRKISDPQQMLLLVGLLMQNLLVPSHIEETVGQSAELVDKLLQLMLCILDGLHNSNNISALSSIPVQWAAVFGLRNTSLLSFIKGLLLKDPCIFHTFQTNIICALNELVESSEEEVIYLLLIFCEKLRVQSPSFLDGVPSEKLAKIHNLFQETIKNWIGRINDSVCGKTSLIQFSENMFAQLWGILQCYPSILDGQANPSLIMDLVNALDELLIVESGAPISSVQSLIAVALASYHKVISRTSSELLESAVFKSLDFVKRYSLSHQILSAVADTLDSVYGSMLEAYTNRKIYHPELVADKLVDALDLFADNLWHSDKGIRLCTLRILCHYEPLDYVSCTKEQPDGKKMKTDTPQTHHTDDQGANVLWLLLSIEATPLSIATSRKIILLISKIQMHVYASRVAEKYVPIILNGIIGIFHNRFSYLWNPALECLAVLIGQYSGLLWEKYVQHLDHFVSTFLISHDQSGGGNTESSSSDIAETSDLIECFKSFVAPLPDSTPSMTVLSLLIQALQRVPSIAESRSRHIVPMFLKFLGYGGGDLLRVESYNSHNCKGKEWKVVLKEWLSLFRLMRNPVSFYLSQLLKDVMLYRLLDDNDAEIQMKALDCLLNWKDDSLRPYDQNLKNLINAKTLREELTTWSLSRESNFINAQHRSYLVPVVIRLLIPKIRKLKTLASRKHTSLFHRKAVLGFLAQLDVDELPLLFLLLMKPLHSQEVDGTSGFLSFSPGGVKNELDLLSILNYFTARSVKSLSWKKRYSFLHVVEEIFAVFDDMRVSPFLDLLMGCVVRVLESCTSTLDSQKSCGSSENEHVAEADNETLDGIVVKQLKELRSLCLKVISFALTKYDDHDFGHEFWDLFFTSVKSLIAGFKQEGASSEKPSSLFSCFLAMSRSHRLVPLLTREKNLIPDIFSMLTVMTASEGIVSCVLKFIENMLNLDNELGDEDTTVKRVLLPHLDVLVCSMHFHFTHNSAAKRKVMKSPGVQELGIIKLLSRYIKEPLAARKFVNILLPVLTKRPQNSDSVVEALQIIGHVVSVLGSECCRKILNAVSPLLIYADSDIRTSICDVLDALAKTDSLMLAVAKLIRELNATSAMEIGGLDYDTIVGAYDRINIQFFYTVRKEHAIIILSHAVHDMSSDELILRQCAFRLLLCFVEFSGKLLRGEIEHGQGFLSGDCVQHLMSNFLLKHMGNAMEKERTVQKGWIDLLREMVLKVPNVVNLKSYQALCSEDLEQDFFNNILHLQKHRRARALTRFRNIVSCGNLSEVITNKVFVPLFFNMLFEVQDGKGEHIRGACVEALASISGCMNWKAYYALLQRCFREMSLKPDKQKVLLRLICSILDHFHFPETHSADQGNRSAMDGLDPDTKISASSTELSKCDSSDELQNIQTCLHKDLLPKIQKMLTSDSERVNVNVSLVALKLLKLLPGDTLQFHLPSIVHRISNFLKNRLESVRDEARSALAACLKELGLEYLQFIVKVLRGTLKRGFELHVLGFTLNFILSKFLLNPIRGSLDYCLEDLLAIAENDILGDVSEEKEVEKIASKMKETRKQKSYETLKLVAQSITFKTHALKLLSPVTVHLQKQLTPKMKSKLENMLNHIAAGIECNPTVNQTELFVFAYGLIKDGIIDEQQGNGNTFSSISNRADQAEMNMPISNPDRLVEVDPRYSHLITVFALGLLQNYMKCMRFDKKDEEMLSMLDPFTSLLGECLNSKYENITSAALRCLSPLVRLPLPSFESLADKIKNSLLNIAQSSLNSSTPLMESCIRLLAVLLRSIRITLSTDQLHMLIQFPLFVDLDRNPSFIALSLLKAIVNRKLVVPEIYDVVQRVADIMVKTQVEPIRKKCSQILLQFLLDYHLSKKRVQQHLDFLLAHLKEGYESTTGKEAALEMLHAIIAKFPVSILDEQCQTIFVQLVLRLANDPDNKIRSMIGTFMKLLIGRVSPQSLQSILEYSLSWYLSGGQQLWSAGAQVLGFLVEVMEKGFQKHINRILPVMSNILKSAASVLVNRQLDSSDESTVPFWKEAYYSLIMLEKILHQFPRLSFSCDLEETWEMICEFLLHPHLWLRSISNRLLGLYFTAATETCRENNEVLVGTFFLTTPSRLFLVAASLCCQLKVSEIDDAAGSLITQNLVFSICGVHSFFSQVKHENPLKFWTTIQPDEQGRFVKAFHLLDSRKGRSVLASLTSDVGSVQNCYMVVSYLLKKMGKIALQMEAIQMQIVFNSFRSISPKLLEQYKNNSPDSKNDCQDYVYQMLQPLYKVCEGYAGKVISDDVKQLAQEVCECIRNTTGMQDFIQVYSQIMKNLKVKRERRKREEKLMAVVNPMRNAKRKLRIAAKNRANKKRRVMTMKMGRWMR